MANISFGQQQIDIILTGIVRAVTKVQKKSHKMFGDFNIFSLLTCCLGRNFQILAIQWTSTKTRKPLLCLQLTQKQQNISTEAFFYHLKHEFGEKKHLRHFFHIFSELHSHNIEKSSRRRFNTYVPSVCVFSWKIEWKQEKNYYIHVT